MSAFFNEVRMTGIEPAHLAALDPKSSVSTSSTTSARLPIYLNWVANIHNVFNILITLIPKK